ncbi:MULTISPECIES: type VI secretion system ATPase TssH [Moraxella]|uniref:ClpV1 family T6SS ATPase n=1 Tax=Moraxella lacunata TaxID=477 RepID=A0A1B8PYT9_MORLA|nr:MULTISPECIES: type VI secretion system ATPase TssH [Moraxella]MBE9578337.1 type VI secretion system ATPase TssH [Moraxella sp. K1664]MBE9588176.1 type VI secretion system ATPase TssH [Moraxella sp. K1630]MBE9590062.1 type VI secretion system ATPase TssH [Moraxella sp. K127]MBE9596275.1 type VI secretion system ATPase TssH [Moraxella sp. K2450]MDH9219074.1 type VI secretion system ATPase TssH [Moraxella lacunata]
MSQINRSALFAKLNTSLYKSLESAFMFAKLRENRHVELSHWIYQLLQMNDTDLRFIESHFELNHDYLISDIANHLKTLKTGYEQVSDFSDDIMALIEESWLYTSLKFNQTHITTGHLIYTLLESNQFKHQLLRISSEFGKINTQKLYGDYDQICQHSIEKPTAQEVSLSPNDPTGQSALARFGTNLTEQARQEKLDPVTGRDNEIRQMVDILSRKKQNNPLLTGEAGVGKTAVVEGLALKIAQGDVPNHLREVEIILLDIGALKAGASVSGEFENRLKAVIKEVNQSPKPIILFIDEIHTLVGAGGAAGTGDAANLLKPALARGELRTIGATTWSEYKKYFEKDPALTRRFQVIQVPEPNQEVATDMLRGLVDRLESHHQVLILDDAVQTAVKFSARYIPARQLPDKAISILDTACARVAVSLNSTPLSITTKEESIKSIEQQIHQLQKQQESGYLTDGDVIAQKQQQIQAIQSELDVINAQYQDQKQLVEALHAIRASIASSDDDKPEEINALKAEQQALITKLQTIQKQETLVHPVVDSHLIAQIIAEWTGIPVGKMMDDEVQKILHLSETLNQRIIGQPHATDMIAKRIQTARTNLDNPNKPIGVFMLTGPSGVGKTETALALADIMYGGEQNLITINMSEYQEPHTVSTLKGAPPGYVGYGEGGVLTEAVRRRPYSVVLLDEIEKAHPDVHEIFFQVFDKGFMEDGEGRYIDFKNTIIILTTNVGSELTLTLCQDELLKPDIEGLATALREPLLQTFPAALLGRIQNIPYYPLNHKMMSHIITLQLNKVIKRMQDNHNITLSHDDAVITLITNRCQEIESGGRMIDAIITNQILPMISHEILLSIGNPNPIRNMTLTVVDNEFKLTIDRHTQHEDIPCP